MNKLRKVVNNTAISLLGQLITWASTLLLTIGYGRFLGDVKFGELYFAMTFVLLAGFPLEFGFNQQLTRDVAQDPSKAQRYFSNTLLMKAALWIILYGLILLFCLALHYNAEVQTLVAICGLTLLSTATANTFAALHYAFERAIFPATGLILEKGLSALIGFFLLKSGFGVVTIAFVLLSGSFISCCWQGFWFFRHTGFSFKLDQALIRELLRSSIPFLTYGVLGVIYYRLDTVLLSLMTSSAVVGWYGAGYRLFDTLIFLPSLVIGAIMYPVFSKLSLSAEKELKVAVEKSMNFLVYCSLPIATMLIVTAPNIIGLLYHQKEFLNTIPVLQALAPGLVFLYINTVLNSVLVSVNLEKKITIMAAIALVFNLTLNLVLISYYQQIGAAVVTSLTELLLIFLAIRFTPRGLLPTGSIRVGIKALLSCLVTALVVLLLLRISSAAVFYLSIVLPVATITYLGTSIALKTIPKEDMQALYLAVKSRKERKSARVIIEQPDISYIDTSSLELAVPADSTQIESDPLSEETQPSLRRIQKHLMAEAIHQSELALVESDPLSEETQPSLRRIQKHAMAEASQQILTPIKSGTLSEDTQPNLERVMNK